MSLFVNVFIGGTMFSFEAFGLMSFGDMNGEEIPKGETEAHKSSLSVLGFTSLHGERLCN